jgi:hypothetical protein
MGHSPKTWHRKRKGSAFPHIERHSRWLPDGTGIPRTQKTQPYLRNPVLSSLVSFLVETLLAAPYRPITTGCVE